MSKTLGSNISDSFYSPAPGVTIQKVTIKSVQDSSNYPLRKGTIKTIGDSQYAPELCLIITDSEDKKHYFFGRFKYKTDPVSGKNISYLGWQPKGNAVWTLLYSLLGDFTINDDDTITQITLNKLIGKTFYKLRYCVGINDEGNLEYKDFTTRYIRADETDAMTKLYNAFLENNYAQTRYDAKAYENYQLTKRFADTKFDPKEFENDENENTPINEDII